MPLQAFQWALLLLLPVVLAAAGAVAATAVSRAACSIHGVTQVLLQPRLLQLLPHSSRSTASRGHGSNGCGSSKPCFECKVKRDARQYKMGSCIALQCCKLGSHLHAAAHTVIC